MSNDKIPTIDEMLQGDFMSVAAKYGLLSLYGRGASCMKAQMQLQLADRGIPILLISMEGSSPQNAERPQD